MEYEDDAPPAPSFTAPAQGATTPAPAISPSKSSIGDYEDDAAPAPQLGVAPKEDDNFPPPPTLPKAPLAGQTQQQESTATPAAPAKTPPPPAPAKAEPDSVEAFKQKFLDEKAKAVAELGKTPPSNYPLLPETPKEKPYDLQGFVNEYLKPVGGHIYNTVAGLGAGPVQVGDEFGGAIASVLAPVEQRIAGALGEKLPGHNNAASRSKEYEQAINAGQEWQKQKPSESPEYQVGKFAGNAATWAVVPEIKGAGLVTNALAKGAEGGLINAISSAGSQFSEKGKVSAQKLLEDIGWGTGLGVLGGAAGHKARGWLKKRAVNRALATEDKAWKNWMKAVGKPDKAEKAVEEIKAPLAGHVEENVEIPSQPRGKGASATKGRESENMPQWVRNANPRAGKYGLDFPDELTKALYISGKTSSHTKDMIRHKELDEHLIKQRVFKDRAAVEKAVQQVRNSVADALEANNKNLGTETIEVPQYHLNVEFEEPQGSFRYNKGEMHGNNVNQIAKEFGASVGKLAEALPPGLFKEVMVKSMELRSAKFIEKTWDAHLKASLTHLIQLADNEAKRFQIKTNKTRELTSHGEQVAAEIRAKMHHWQFMSPEALIGEKAKVEEMLGKTEGPMHRVFQLQAEAIEAATRLSSIDREGLNVKAPDTKHLYVAVDREHLPLEKEFTQALPKNWEHALALTQELTADVKAAGVQLEKLKDEALPLFEQAEKLYQEHFKTNERLNIDMEVPHASGKTIPASISMVFNSHTTYFVDSFKKFYTGVMYNLKREASVSQEVVKHSVPAAKTPDIKARLANKGGLLPGFDRLKLVPLVFGGVQSLSAPADAFDGQDGQAKRDLGMAEGALLFGSAAAIACILAKKHGVRQSQVFMKSKDALAAFCIHNSKNLMLMSDKLLGRSGKESVVDSLRNVLGHALMAQWNATHRGENSTDVYEAIWRHAKPTLSKEAQKEVNNIHSLWAETRLTAKRYERDWNQYYKNIPEHERHLLSSLAQIDGNVNFVSSVLNDPDRTPPPLKMLKGIVSNTTKSLFNMNLGQAYTQATELVMNGPRQMGWSNYFTGAKLWATDKEIRPFITQVAGGGARTQQISELGATEIHPLNLFKKGRAFVDVHNEKLQKFALEEAANQQCQLGSLAHYFETNPGEMEGLGIHDVRTFIKKVLTGDIDENVRLSAAAKVGIDLGEALGADPTNILSLGWVSRMGSYIKYTRSAERDTQLLWNCIARKDWKSLAITQFLRLQFGGPAVFAAEGLGFLWLADPHNAAKLVYLAHSVASVEYLTGNMQNKHDFGFVLTMLMGQMNPGVDTLLQTAGDVGTFLASMNNTVYTILTNPGLLGGSLQDPEVQQLTSQIRGLGNVLQTVIPEIPIVHIPTGLATSMLSALPGIINDQVQFGTYSPFLGNPMSPLEANQVREYPGARWDQLAKGLRGRLGDKATTYQIAIQGEKLGQWQTEEGGLDMKRFDNALYDAILSAPLDKAVEVVSDLKQHKLKEAIKALTGPRKNAIDTMKEESGIP